MMTDANRPPQTVLISSLKNEGPFILEWVAYHRRIGFDRIVIGHNDCTDGSDDLLNALAEIGWVRTFENKVKPGRAPQDSAADRFAEIGDLQPGDWVIWLDLDEFLNVKVGDGTVQALIATMGGADAMLIPWRLFGDAGKTEFRGRFISTDFTACGLTNHPAHATIKTLFRMDTYIQRFDIHRPHLTSPELDRRPETINASGAVIPETDPRQSRWYEGGKSRITSRIASGYWSSDFAQINHYAVRTKSLFELKKLRGRGYKPAKDTNRHGDEYFAEMNRIDDEDTSILQWEGPVSAEIAKARAAPAVAAAQDRVDAILTENLLTVAKVPPPCFDPPQHAAYRAAQQILEYGVSDMTQFAAEETRAKVLSVDTDAEKIAEVSARLPDAHNVIFHHVDLGPTGKNGYPDGTDRWADYPEYAFGPWDTGYIPDLVVIGGRFRLACLAATMLSCKQRTRVVIRDYEKRKHYQRCAALVPDIEIAGGVGIMDISPRPYNRREMAAMTRWFFDLK